MDRPRKAVMHHLRSSKNLGLITARGTKSDIADHFLCTSKIIEKKCGEASTQSTIFPLYLISEDKGEQLAIIQEREANISPTFVAALQERIGIEPAPEAIFHYAYAVFHAPTYRQRYVAFLKIDFPRLPLPPDRAAFETLAELGAKLVALHLLEAPGLNRPGIAFPVGGDHRVQKLRAADRYLPPSALALENDTGLLSGRVRLNEKEYFENVPPEAWEFRVGGYQPAYKWLDDRADRFLTDDDIIHYMRMLAALRETAALLPEVDAAFTSPPNPLS